MLNISTLIANDVEYAADRRSMKAAEYPDDADRNLEAAACLYRIAADLKKIGIKKLDSGGRVYTFGNGGSAADAQHFAGELVGRYLRERRPLAASALSVDPSVVTSIGNDYSFVFRISGPDQTKTASGTIHATTSQYVFSQAYSCEEFDSGIFTGRTCSSGDYRQTVTSGNASGVPDP